MHIFTLEVENNNFDNAELVSAPERSIELENHLRNWLENSPWVLVQAENILWIHKERRIPGEEDILRPDLLGVDSAGNLVIVELKRGRTERETVAQLLEYASWAVDLSEAQICGMAETYFNTRDEFKGKTFEDAFRNVFDLLEADEVPPLNRRLCLYIVAGRISEKVLKVCRFLRTSHSMNISCIAVSMFQTESQDVIVGMETKLGDGNRVTPTPSQNRHSDTLRWRVVWETILRLTNRDPSGEFTTREVRDAVLDEHLDFNNNTISGSIYSFRQSRHIVLEAIQQLRDRNTDIDFTVESIMQVVPEEPSDFNQLRIREMAELFCQFGIPQIHPNQTEQETEK